MKNSILFCAVLLALIGASLTIEERNALALISFIALLVAVTCSAMVQPKKLDQ
jgi:hypothetical protein